MTMSFRFSRLLIPMLALLGLPLTAAPQQKTLTFDDLYGPGRRPDLSGHPPMGLAWLDDTHYLWPREIRQEGRPVRFELLKVEADTGKSEPLFDPSKMEAAIADLPGVTASEARSLSLQRAYRMNPSHTAVLLTIDGDLYYYRLGDGAAIRLTTSRGEERDPTFSPDGTRAAFVRDNNLHVVDIDGAHERALTTDGGPDLLNGTLDWLYAEEIYGRASSRAFWWSPDSARIAFLQLDEKGVPGFPVTDHLGYRHRAPEERYPTAGETNPRARLGIVAAAGGPVAWAESDRYTPGATLIVNVAWKPDSRSVAYQVQNREQTWLDLNVASSTGVVRHLLRETTPAWVDVIGSPTWLKDGSFLWLSDRTGWRHIYHVGPDGVLKRALTSGDWAVRSLHGVDPAGGSAYFSASQRSSAGRDVYRVKLDGTAPERLSTAAGSHTPRWNAGFTRYLDFWSDVSTPTQVRLHRGDGSEVRVLHSEPIPALRDYRLPRTEFHRIAARDGTYLQAMLMKPPGFDPSRRYPVLQVTYAGPGFPMVRNSWGAVSFEDLVASHGVLVWVCDNRSASGGARHSWPVHRSLGEKELLDIEDGIAWLKKLPYVDASRIGLYGHSYGGFMTAYALTHSKSFALGIASSGVYDWRNYDTIYTERYMGLPQDNPEGYRKSAPRFAAKDLHGKLLLLHGTMDDNVHVGNALQFAHELQKAGKPFQMMLYPASGHGVGDPDLRRHMHRTMLDFILENLRPEGRQK